MKLSTLTSTIPASFEYIDTDNEGNERKSEVKLEIRRVSFATALTAEKAFKELDALEIGKLLTDLIADWNLFKDDAETEKFPITPEWFASPHCPADFFTQLTNCVFDKVSGKVTASDSLNGSEPEARSSQASAAS